MSQLGTCQSSLAKSQHMWFLAVQAQHELEMVIRAKSEGLARVEYERDSLDAKIKLLERKVELSSQRVEVHRETIVEWEARFTGKTVEVRNLLEMWAGMDKVCKVAVHGKGHWEMHHGFPKGLPGHGVKDYGHDNGTTGYKQPKTEPPKTPDYGHTPPKPHDPVPPKNPGDYGSKPPKPYDPEIPKTPGDGYTPPKPHDSVPPKPYDPVPPKPYDPATPKNPGDYGSTPPKPHDPVPPKNPGDYGSTPPKPHDPVPPTPYDPVPPKNTGDYGSTAPKPHDPVPPSEPPRNPDPKNPKTPEYGSGVTPPKTGGGQPAYPPQGKPGPPKSGPAVYPTMPLTPETPGDGDKKKDYMPATPVPGEKKPAAAPKKDGKKDSVKT